MKKHILFAVFAVLSFAVSAQNNWGPRQFANVATMNLAANKAKCGVSVSDAATSKLAYVHDIREFYWYNCDASAGAGAWVKMQVKPEITSYLGIAGVAPAFTPVVGDPILAMNSVGELYRWDGTAWVPFSKESEITLASISPVGTPTNLQKIWLDTLASPTRQWLNEGGVWVEQKNACVITWTQAGLVVNGRYQWNGSAFVAVTDTAQLDFYFVNRLVSGTTFEILRPGCNGKTLLADGAYYAAQGTAAASSTPNCRLIGTARSGVFSYSPVIRCGLSGGSGGSTTATAVTNTPAGNIAAITVQAAINELDAEKQTKIQFQDDSTNVSTLGGITTVNFIGSSVKATSTVPGFLNVKVDATALKAVPAILVFGESNSGGFAPNGSASAAEIAVQPDVKMWSNVRRKFESLNFSAAGNNIQGHTGLVQGNTHGIELQIANRAAEFYGDTVWMVKSGQGASKVGQWKGAYMDTLRVRVAAATLAMRNQGLTPVWSVFLSIGINDAIAGTDVELFRDSLQKIISHVRASVTGEAHFYVTQLTPIYAAYNEEIAHFAKWRSGVSVIPTAGLSVQADNNHWDYAGMKGLSNRFIDSLFFRGDGVLGTLQQDVNDPVFGQSSDAYGPYQRLQFEKSRQNVADGLDGRVVSTLNSTANYLNNIGGVDSIIVDANRDWRLIQLIESPAPTTYTNPLQIDSDAAPDYAWANAGPVHTFYNTYYQFNGDLYVTNTSNAAVAVAVAPPYPYYLKREKSGNDIIMSTSPDGYVWTQRHVAVNAIAGATNLHFRIAMPTVVGFGDNQINGRVKAWLQQATSQARIDRGVSAKFLAIGGTENTQVTISNPAPATLEVDGKIGATSLRGSEGAYLKVGPDGVITRVPFSWTTATRPVPSAGEFPFGFNTTLAKHEGWNGTIWNNAY